MKSGVREIKCPVKRMRPQGSLLTTAQASRGHSKKDLRNRVVREGEKRRIKSSRLSP